MHHSLERHLIDLENARREYSANQVPTYKKGDEVQRMSKLSTKLKRIGACDDAVEWSKGYDDDQVAWDACERGDWLLWIIGKRLKSKPWSDERKPLVLCCIEVTLTVKHLWPKAQAANLDAAMRTLQKWCNGKATTEEANAATCAAKTSLTHATPPAPLATGMRLG